MRFKCTKSIILFTDNEQIYKLYALYIFMDEANLTKIVLDQQNRLEKLSLSYPRDKLNDISNIINHKINIVVTGHRRVGKSTFLLQVMSKHYKNKFYYLDFSDERLIDFQTKDFQLLYEIFLKNFGDRNIFLFDEIQGKYDWNKFVNRLYAENKRFFITGSNADLLSKEISTYLTGRHFDITIYPFSFKEYLGYKKFKENYNSTKGQIKIRKYLEDYIKSGGFPEVIIFNNSDILQNIYQDVLNKDILNRYTIKDENNFKKISLFLLSNIAKKFSYTSLKNNFGLGSVNTAKDYVSYLTNSYIFFEHPLFDYSLKKQNTYSKKIYCIDAGLVNKMAFAFSENIGRLYENVVFIELKRKNKETYYWENESKLEVDFLIVEKQKVKELIQVCYDLSNEKTKEREINALVFGLKEFKLNEGIIITQNIEKEEIIDNKKIKYIPLWKWLLE